MPRAPSTLADDSVNAYLDSLSQLHQRLDEGMSFSGHERNKVFLNCGAVDRRAEQHPGFAEASAVSGLDFDDDARGLAFFDWDFDGDLDLAISNRTAPRIRLMRNLTPGPGGFVSLLLEGDGLTSSRDAIGARVTVETSEGTLIRSVRAGEGFLSQSSRWLHFGLGSSKLSGRTAVRWPGGDEELFEGARAGGRYRLVQGEGRARELGSVPRELSLSGGAQRAASPSSGERVILSERPPAPALTLQPFASERPVAIEQGKGTPVLLNLWASWCLPCRLELRELASQASAIRSAGVEVVALSTDGLGDRPRTEAADAEQMMAEIAFPFPNGLATAESLDKVDIVKRYLFDRKFPLSLPFSLLIDRWGRIAALYRGGVDPRSLVRDVTALDTSPDELRELSVPFPGSWLTPAPEHASVVAYARWFEDRFPEEAVSFLLQAVDLARSTIDESEPGSLVRARARQELAEAYRRLGFVERRRSRHAVAAEHYRSVLQLEPRDQAAISGLFDALLEGGDYQRLKAEIEARLERRPADPDLRVRLAEVHEREGSLELAARELTRAVELDPGRAQLRYLLGSALARQGLAQAFEQLHKAVELDPDHAAAHALLGAGWLSESDLAKAVDHLARAVELSPELVEARHALARAQAESGKMEEAIGHYRALIEVAPQRAAAHYELAVALVGVGRVAEAEDHFGRAYALDRRFLAAANSLAWMLATHREEELRDADLAVTIARQINAASDRSEPAFLETLAAALAETGDFAAASQTIERAISLAHAAGQTEQVKLLASRLELYRQRRTGR